MNLSELTKKRSNHLASCQLNGDYSHKIIANLYSDSTHFIYELLQNAEDAQSTIISFFLYQDYLKISHNGREFNFDDIESITTIGSSTKSNEPNKIGKFGAGFKSVFSITNTPHIYSKNFNFKINQYIVPEHIEPLMDHEKELTTLILPFDKSEDNQQELFKTISQRIKSIGKDELLFLNNICRIEWQILDEVGYVEKKVKNVSHLYSIATLQSTSKKEQFALYGKHFTIEEKELSCKIAFALNDNNEYICIDRSFLYVFFPTVINTNLNFLVHAPYKTTPNRETINFSDPQNKIITTHIIELYKSILIDLADSNLLKVDTFKLLPLTLKMGELYSSLFQSTTELFKTYPLIPTNDRRYVLPTELFDLSSELNYSLFYESHIHTLFNKTAWLDEDFYKQSNISAKQFLNSYLNITQYRLNDIVNLLNESFLLKQSDKWIGGLYGEFAKSIHLVNPYLSTKPLARLEDGTHTIFKSEKGEIQVYLNTGNSSQFRCLHIDTQKLPEAKKFLASIGVKEPDVIDEIKEFIVPMITIVPDDNETKENYFSSMEKLLYIFHNATVSDKNRIVELIKKTACFLSENQKSLLRPNDIYLSTDQIKLWFSNNQKVHIMDENLWKILNETELVALLQFHTTPKILNIEPHIDSKQKEDLRHTPIIAQMQGDDFELEGLEELLNKPINKETTLMIWNFLITHLEKKNILRGYYRWQSSANHHEKEFDSKICVALKRTKWLHDSDEKLCKPLELKVEQLMSDYEYDLLGVELKERVSLLSFKSNAIEEIEKNGLVVIEAEYFEKLKKLEQQTIENDIKWSIDNFLIPTLNDEIDPDIEIEVKQFESKLKKTRDLRYQSEHNFFDQDEDEYNKKVIPKHIRKSIGEKSEKYVYQYLKKYCNDHSDKGWHIKWMNEHGNTGIGYDFVIMQGEKEIQYIEVKSDLSNTKKVEISKTQWEFAKYLNDQSEGNRFVIFVVTSLKDSLRFTTINNPILKWMKNELSINGVELIYDSKENQK